MKTLVYIPTFPADAAASLKQQIIERFGGCTFYEAKGAWRMPDGHVETEPVEIVEVYSPRKDATENTSWFHTACTNYGVAANQDAVLVVHDSEPEFIHTRAAA